MYCIHDYGSGSDTGSTGPPYAPNLLGTTCSLSKANQCEEAPHCTCRTDSVSSLFPHRKPAGAQAGRKDLRSQHS
jgi:hypothetical protein